MRSRMTAGFVGSLLCVVVSVAALSWRGPAPAAHATEAAVVAEASGQDTEAQDTPPKHLDVPFVPTPHEVVDKMLEVAQIKDGDVLYDLGCGDGRIVIAAAKKHGIKAVGIDIDPRRVAESRQNVDREGVADLVTIKQADLFEEDLSGADVVTMYLLPNVNERLKPQLQKLKPGSRIVSHSFSMRGAKPEKVVPLETEGGRRTIFLWTVPWEEE